MRNLAKVFKALSDRNRIRILKMLEVTPMCVCELTHVLGTAQSSVSHHLGILREAGFIIDEKDGLWVTYSLVNSKEDIIATIMTGLRRWGNDDSQIAEDKQKAMVVNRDEICARG